MDKQEITLSGEYITLGQFLKWQNIAGSGSEAKFLIQEGMVLVNEEIEKRRGRKLYPGDAIVVLQKEYVLKDSPKGIPNPDVS